MPARLGQGRPGDQMQTRLGNCVHRQEHQPAALFPEAEQPEDSPFDDEGGDEGGGQPGQKAQGGRGGVADGVGLPVVYDVADEIPGVGDLHGLSLVRCGGGNPEGLGQAGVGKTPAPVFAGTHIAKNRVPVGRPGGIGQHPAVPLQGAQVVQNSGVTLTVGVGVGIFPGRALGQQIQVELPLRGVDHGDGHLRLGADVGVGGGDEAEQAQH